MLGALVCSCQGVFMPGVPCFQVDAFTRQAFSGNPAAVCLLDRPVDESWMQAVAAEMNLAETAFVLPVEDGEFSLRWFTPEVEVDLCGHATLASAHVLWSERGRPNGDLVRFRTKSGVLTCRKEGDRIVMDFPATPVRETPPRGELLAALDIPEVNWTGETGFDDVVLVDSESAVRRLAPDFRRLKGCTRRGVIVTARAESADADFVSRFFAPRVGIDEDPVTGSAHCCLGPFWAQRLGRMEVVGFQASRRGGTVGVKVLGERVELIGEAVTVLRGELL